MEFAGQMNNNRRQFIQKIAGLGLGFGFQSFMQPALAQTLANNYYQTTQITDEDFWKQVAKAWTKSKSLINFNSGGVSPAPISVVKAMMANYELSNEIPSYNMWRVLDKKRETVRAKLAEMAGADIEEIAINRNTTEALNSIIFGLTLQKGDEVIHTNQDYPNMINAWKQRELRDGVVVKKINLNLPTDNDDQIVAQYVSQFTNRTKIVHITHIINWNGHILPVRKIADEAHRRGIEVIVDAAHSFAHLKFSFSDLGADYAGTSLHKWLYAPFGCGMLYIKKDKIKNVWPLLSSPTDQKNSIRKFENLGTRNFASEMAIIDAVDFNNMVGVARKQKRLIYLKNYWTSAVAQLQNIKFNTSTEVENSCAIANFSLTNMTVSQLDSALSSQYKIHTVGIQWPGVNGVRVTTNLFTSKNDLDKLITAITTLSKQ